MEVLAAPADRARRFSRFWTREIGLLHEGLLDTPHSLTEARVIYELGQVPETTATALAHSLALDPGHLSRVLAGLEASGLVSRRRSPADGRAQLISLARAGRAAFAELDRRSAEQATELLERLPPDSAGTPARRDGHDRGVARRREPRPVARDPAAAAGRVRLGDPAPRRAVRPRVRLRHELRGTRGADRRVLPRALRPGARALLDRSTGRRARRLRLLRGRWAAESRSCAS